MVLAEPSTDGLRGTPSAVGSSGPPQTGARPAAEPVSNNRVDPSPYYPVFGRRMVMIGYARRPQTRPNRSDNTTRPAVGVFGASEPHRSPDGCP